jgi:hypothetical protein
MRMELNLGKGGVRAVDIGGSSGGGHGRLVDVEAGRGLDDGRV